MNDDFYKSLPSLSSFSEIFSQENFQDVPDDWWVALTDVVGSTKAIEAGRYKEVNSAGSIGVMAISNYLKDMSFPFIFGGDGMTCLVPDSVASPVKELLIGTGRAVKKMFNLELRLAMIPVQVLKEAGKTLSLAKWQVSPEYSQAILEGDGIDQAETYLKTPGSPYLLSLETPTSLEPDFTGYTCRWEDFPSPFGETVALLIKFRHPSKAERLSFLTSLDQIIGKPEVHHPLRVETSRMALFNVKRLNNEAAVITGSPQGWNAFVYRMKMRYWILICIIFIKFNIHVSSGKIDISQIRQNNMKSSDFRKYDNSLKMILALKKSSRMELEKFLQESKAKGEIFYGLHVTDRAMITCLMHNKGESEVHFVDAADGGYAYAAKKLKQQMKETS